MGTSFPIDVPFIMLLPKTSLCSLVALAGMAVAGPKRPGSPQIATRVYNYSTGVSLTILTETGVKSATAPDLYGWIIEDINHSGDGGLYGELLTSRVFDGSDVTRRNISKFIGNSIVYQENTCEAFGTFVEPNFQLQLTNFRFSYQWIQATGKHRSAFG